MEIKDRLLILYDLHKVDKELEELNSLKGDLPARIQEMNDEKSDKENELSEVQIQFDDIVKREESIKEENDKSFKHIQKNDEVLRAGGVNNNDEYNALANEIDTAYEVIEKNDEMLEKEINPQKTDLSQKMNRLRRELDELSENLHSTEEELEELEKVNEEEEKELNGKREDIMKRIDREDLDLYERINKAKPGEAIALVRKGSCLGCYNSIPPQREIEIKMARQFYNCETCGRLLIHEDLIK